jgi:hypothetical protein
MMPTQGFFGTLKDTLLTDGFIPKHTNNTSGLQDSRFFTASVAGTVLHDATLDLTLASTAATPKANMGFLFVSSLYSGDYGAYTNTIYAVISVATTLTLQSIATVNGSGGGVAFTITLPSAGVLRFTDTNVGGGTVECSMSYIGVAYN